MPREDTVSLLKRLLAREITDAGDNEVLDEIVALRDPLTLADQVAVTETNDFRAIADVSLAGFCEAVEQLAVVDSQADWQAGTLPPQADAVSVPGTVLLAAQNLLTNPSFIGDSNADGLADGWTVNKWFAAGGTCNLSLVPSTVDYGTAQRIEGSGWNNLNGNRRVLLGQNVNWIPSATYTVRGKVDVRRLDGTTRASIEFSFGAAGWRGLGTIATVPTNGFIDFEYTTVAPSNATAGAVYFELNSASDGAGGEAVWDLLQVVQGPLGTPFSLKYWPVVTIQTKELDLGAVPLTRPVLLFPVLGLDSPAAGSATVTRYRTRATQADAWGPWINAVQLPSGGALTVGPPQRYLQAEIQSATTDTTVTPILDRFGVYD